MDLYISSHIRNNIVLAILAIMVLVLISIGFQNGKRQAESVLILNWASEEVLALQYFYNDNNRFPSADEFVRAEVTENYFIKAPLTSSIQIPQCPEILKYARPQPENYELYFCLPKAEAGYQLGWNQTAK